MENSCQHTSAEITRSGITNTETDLPTSLKSYKAVINLGVKDIRRVCGQLKDGVAVYRWRLTSRICMRLIEIRLQE